MFNVSNQICGLTCNFPPILVEHIRVPKNVPQEEISSQSSHRRYSDPFGGLVCVTKLIRV